MRDDVVTLLPSRRLDRFTKTTRYHCSVNVKKSIDMADVSHDRFRRSFGIGSHLTNEAHAQHRDRPSRR